MKKLIENKVFGLVITLFVVSVIWIDIANAHNLITDEFWRSNTMYNTMFQNSLSIVFWYQVFAATVIFLGAAATITYTFLLGRLEDDLNKRIEFLDSLRQTKLNTYTKVTFYLFTLPTLLGVIFLMNPCWFRVWYLFSWGCIAILKIFTASLGPAIEEMKKKGIKETLKST